MEPPYTSSKYSYSHLSINVVANGQISIISEIESKWRLAGQSTQSKTSSPSNQEALERIKGRASSHNSTSVNNKFASTGHPLVSSNQDLLNKIRATQRTSSSQSRSTLSKPSTNTGGSYPQQKPIEKSVVEKIFNWLFK